MMDYARIKELRDFIKGLPEEACRQTCWRGLGSHSEVKLPSGQHLCDTAGCIAGWAAMLYYDSHEFLTLSDLSDVEVPRRAADWLKLSDAEAFELFHYHNEFSSQESDMLEGGGGWREPMVRALDVLLKDKTAVDVWKKVWKHYQKKLGKR